MIQNVLQPEKSTANNSTNQNSDREELPLPPAMFKNSKKQSANQIVLDIDNSPIVLDDSDASSLPSPPSPSTSPTALAWRKRYAMTGRGGEFLGDDQFEEFDRLDVKLPIEMIDPKSKFACRLPASTDKEDSIASAHKSKSTSPPPHKKSSPRPKFDLLSRNNKPPSASGSKRMWGRIIAKNTRDMHLGNRKRSKQQKNERAIAKTRDAAFREHAATAEEVCVAVTNSVGIPASQLSQYVDGSLRNNMGELF